MRKFTAAFLASLLVMVSMSVCGCGDDDPVDPPTETCSINVTSPLEGSGYTPGDDDDDTVNIRWSKTGDAALVKIDLLKGGDLVANIHPSVANGGFYRWTANNLGAANGSDFAIRVTAHGDDGCSDISGAFSLINTVGCAFNFTHEFHDELVAGDNFDLTWDSNNTTGKVDIQLRYQDRSLGFIAVGIDDTGIFEWTIDSLHNGSYSNYFLRIMDHDLPECMADGVDFAMVDNDVCYLDFSSPLDDAVWDEGATQNIMLTAAPGVSTVSLRLFIGNVFVDNIDSSVSVDDFPYAWNVMDFGNTQSPTQYKIVAVSNDDEYCVGESGTFTIISH